MTHELDPTSAGDGGPVRQRREAGRSLWSVVPLLTPRATTALFFSRLRWMLASVAVGVAGTPAIAQVPEPSLPRPGAVVVQDVIGEAVAVNGDQRKPIKAEERLRVGSTIVTERMSIVTLILSNGATLRIGSEAELEVEEFGQATIPGGIKFAELKAEPTVSRTRLHLVRGDVVVNVKPLSASRGSSFVLTMLAGTVRTTEGTFHARVRMSDLGLGICTLELEKGAAEFEVAGGKFAPVPVGQQLAFSIEMDKATGLPKVGEMPKPVPAKAADTAKGK
jgi:hypothetical protein